MWNEIVNNDDAEAFMDKFIFFHDSCIKELKYLSGAYVDEQLQMHPINDKRLLRVVIQRQYEELSAIELEFIGVKYLKLFPDDERYTCEILDSSLILKDNCIIWCDCGSLTENNFDDYQGTVICATKLRWRYVDNYLGDKELYVSLV